MHIFQLCLEAVFPTLLVLAAVRDVMSFTIPNWISIAALAAFPPVAIASGLGLTALCVALGVGALMLFIGMGMFAFGWIGGGDAKLMAVCGLWLGWSAFLPFLVLTGAAGGALAVLLLILRKASFWLPPRLPGWVKRLATPGENVPYGVAIAVGALAVFPTSPVAAAIGHALS